MTSATWGRTSTRQAGTVAPGVPDYRRGGGSGGERTGDLSGERQGSPDPRWSRRSWLAFRPGVRRGDGSRIGRPRGMFGLPGADESRQDLEIVAARGEEIAAPLTHLVDEGVDK